MIGSLRFMVVSLLAYASSLPVSAPADMAVLLFAGALLVLGT